MRLNPRLLYAFPPGTMQKRTALTAWLVVAMLALCAVPASAQIAKVVDDAGRRFFINADPPLTAKLSATKPRTNIYLPAETSFTGRNRGPNRT
jgi:hypothetical protein